MYLLSRKGMIVSVQENKTGLQPVSKPAEQFLLLCGVGAKSLGYKLGAKAAQTWSNSVVRFGRLVNEI